MSYVSSITTLMALNINRNSYKVGIDEVDGLTEAMTEALAPVLARIKEKIYWDDSLAIDPTEYKSRDGFIPYADNCGGVEISLIIPAGEQYGFEFLQFGECDDSECDHESECIIESEGHLDAKLRVWLKFEGVQDGTMSFWLYLGGGNGDAPYFRTKYEATVFEASFQAKTLAEFNRKARVQVSKLLKVIGVK